MKHQRIGNLAMQHRRLLCVLAAVSLLLGLVGPAHVLPVRSVQAAGSVTLDGAVSTGTADDTDTISISHTTGTGDNRLMLVGVSWNAASTNSPISAVRFTYDATELPLTEVITQQRGTQYRWAAIYRLLDPPSGQGGTVVVDFSDSVSGGIVAGAANFAGVDQTTPLGTPDGAESDAGSEASVTLTGLNGDELVFDTVWVGGASPPSLTVGADQDQHWNDGVGNSSGGASTEEATGSSVTMSWTRGGDGLWAIAAVPINPVPSTDPTITITGTPLDAFTSQPGTPSAEQSYTVSGSNLTDDITITPPADFELSLTSGSGFGTSPLVLTQSGGSVAATDIFVRFNRATQGTSAGDITHTSTGATQQDVAVSGTANPIALDGAVSTGTDNGVNSIDIPHTTGTGTNRLMLVGVSWNCGSTNRTITSVTFTPSGGGATGLQEVWTQLAGSTESDPRYSAIYSLLNPPSGVAGTVTVTFSGDVSNGIVAGVASFAGADQTTPLGTPDGDSTTSGDNPTVTLTGLSGDELVFDNVFQGASGATQTLTAGTDQTRLWHEFAGNARGAASTKQATESSATMSWTAASSSYWAIAAVPINPAAVEITHTLSVDVNPDAGGTTDPPEGDHIYAEDAVVDITATPNEGYEFSNWSGDCTGTDPDVCQVTMDGDKSVTAEFTELAPTCYALTLSHTGEGSDPVASPANSDDCPTGEYVAGESISLSGAAPDLGWAIGSWTGTDDDASTASTNSLTMPASAHTAEVNYLRILGDVNLDGEADSTDALVILSCDVGIDTSEYCPMNCGDANADGLINSTDALIILSYDAGISVSFAVGEPGCPASVTPCPGCGAGPLGADTGFQPRWSGSLE